MEKIGLKAVVDTSDFQAGMQTYVSGIDRMENAGEKLVRSMADLGYMLGAGFSLAARAADMALSEICQELREAVKDVYENTEEWEGLTEAYDNFWRSVVISAASRDELLGFFETLTGWIDQTSEAMLQYSASQQGYTVAMTAAIAAQEPGPLQDVLAVLSQFGLGQVGQRAAGAIAIWAENQGWLNEELNLGQIYMEAYNMRLEENKQALAEASGMAEKEAKAQEETAKMVEELTRLRDRASDKYQTYMAQTLAAEEKYNQRVIDLNITRARRIEDLDRKLAQQRQQLAAQLAQRMAQIEAQEAERTEQARYDHAQRMAEIEEAYQERLRQIQQRYQVSAQDAIRRRDALALVNARRTRDSELDEAKRDRDKQQNEASTDYARQQDLQRRNLETQRQQAQQAYQEQLAALDASRQEQEDELDRSLQRQLEDLERHNKWALAAMKKKFGDEYREAMQAYTNQETLYAEHLARMRVLFDRFQTPARGPQPTGSQGFIGGFQEGGAFVTQGPTTATFGEGGIPELVVAQPLQSVASQGGGGSMNVSGTMRHEVSGAVSGLMAGYEGRLSAMISQAVMQAFTEVLRR